MCTAIPVLRVYYRASLLSPVPGAGAPVPVSGAACAAGGLDTCAAWPAQCLQCMPGMRTLTPGE